MAQIHPTAIVDPKAQLAESVVIGPYCTVGPNVKVGEGTVLESHVILKGHTTIGKNNKIYPFAAIGIEPQDKKYRGEPTRLVIGDDNVIREHCTLSTGTVQDHGETKVGNRNLLMANVHIAHDCQIGDDTILANNVGLAGHVVIEDKAIVGGQVGIHQFIRIGYGAMLSGGTMMRQDILPFAYYQGNPGKPSGINMEGMKRLGYSKEAIHAAREVYKIIFREGNTIKEATEEIKELIETLEEPQAKQVATQMCEFLGNATRGLAR
ncbi:MAG: acyl-ACP--UDP-N-acetylglucosamine O-acyltransferase [Burkholderiales bacterium]|nr:acyl-ACP--UDP-N-acetylglucosamine O-acyltransferase [Burkholderiales bacterium]